CPLRAHRFQLAEGTDAYCTLRYVRVAQKLWNAYAELATLEMLLELPPVPRDTVTQSQLGERVDDLQRSSTTIAARNRIRLGVCCDLLFVPEIFQDRTRASS